MVLDTETSNLDPLSAELVGLSVCVDPEQAFYMVGGIEEAVEKAKKMADAE